MADPKFSVIIPAFNAESTINRCVDSIIGQSFHDFEIIVVNDGSKDGTSDILEELSRSDDRIVVVNQPNGGSAAARNTGLAKAGGDWIIWVDSDDYIDNETLSFLNAAIEKTGADIVTYGYVRHVGISETKIVSIRGFKDKADLFTQYVKAPFHSLCVMASKKRLWTENGICFIPGQNFCEDLNATFKLLGVGKKIECLDIAPYHYINNDLSMCNNLTSRNTEQEKANILDMYKFMSRLPIYPQIRASIAPLVLKAKQPLARKRVRAYVETASDMNKYIIDSPIIPLHKKIYLLALVYSYPLWKYLIKK